MKIEDKAGISYFIHTLSTKETEKLCEYGRYIVGKKLYNTSFLYKFNGCKNKGLMYESLLRFRDYNAIIKLGDKALTEEDAAYMAVAYYRLGNKDKYNTYLAKVKDIELSGMVKRAIARGNL